MMSVPTTHPAATAISFNSGFVNDNETVFTIKCPDRNFSRAHVLDEADRELFTLRTGGFLTSWSMRRSLLDSEGNHLLDLRRYHSRLSKWIIEDSYGQKLCIVEDGVDPVRKATIAKAEIFTHQDVVGIIEIRSFDHAGIRTVFQDGETVIAEMELTDDNDMSFLKMRGVMRTAWMLRVASGVDVAMILALAFCRAEILHLWRR